MNKSIETTMVHAAYKRGWNDAIGRMCEYCIHALRNDGECNGKECKINIKM